MKAYALGSRKPRYSEKQMRQHPLLRAFLAKQDRKERDRA